MAGPINGKRADALSEILALAESEKENRGLSCTPREIAQQPETWGTTFNLCFSRSEQIIRLLELSRDSKTQTIPRVILVGAGTSDYVGQSVQSVLAKQWGCDVTAVPSTDLLTSMDDFIHEDRPYIWISFSRSGDSPESVAVVQSALERFPLIRHILITCNEQSRLAREFGTHPRVLLVVLNDVVNDRGLAMTSSFSNLVVAGQCLAHLRSPETYRDILQKITDSAASFMGPCADLAASLAEQNFSRVCFLGTGSLKAVARESALKALELTAGKVHGFWESYLGLRHGPLSAVNARTLVVGFISADQAARSYELDLLAELREKRLPGKIVTVCPFFTEGIAISDDVISLNLESVPDDYRPIIDVILGQLFGLFASLHHGVTPDHPSPNGAISRVVRPIKIYEGTHQNGVIAAK
jgi:tagatose-6-phosphate ketose/aldose isomerase